MYLLVRGRVPIFGRGPIGLGDFLVGLTESEILLQKEVVEVALFSENFLFIAAPLTERKCLGRILICNRLRNWQSGRLFPRFIICDNFKRLLEVVAGYIF